MPKDEKVWPCEHIVVVPKNGQRWFFRDNGCMVPSIWFVCPICGANRPKEPDAEAELKDILYHHATVDTMITQMQTDIVEWHKKYGGK